MKSLGKLLQLAGLGLPPVSILAQLNESISAKQMLIILVASVCAFFLGRIIEGYSS